MSSAFDYKPKFVDIRIRPPKAEDDEAARMGLKPGERPCDGVGCRKAATSKAPKARDMDGEFYWFCQQHAAEYNRSWDYYAGLSEAEVRARQENERATGGRPTWQFKASRESREAAAFAAREGQGAADPFGILRKSAHRAAAEAAGPTRKVGRLEGQALADLDLDEDADAATIRVRYLELVKRCHPDANGGDRGAEQKLQRVIKAYKTLQKAKMA